MTLQFILYNLTFLMVIAHFLDSAKEREWTDFLYRGNYIGWLISSLLLLALALAGIVSVWIGSQAGNILSILVGLGGLGAAGYHIPMHRMKKSEVCHNKFSYGLMVVLSLLCVALIVVTLLAGCCGDKQDKQEQNMSITVNLRYTGTDGNARKFAEEMISSGTVDAIRAEEGNLRYEYYQSLHDPETILLIDSWANQEAIDKHHATPMMDTIAKLREKYDLHMTVERYTAAETPETENQFIRK